MDTRFWGPSGWNLLHNITLNYVPNDKNKKMYENFLQSLPYILPCIYCRRSLTEYYLQFPLNNRRSSCNPLSSNENLNLWLYNIHNCVNEKLRSQGLCHTKNPSFNETLLKYKTDNNCEKIKKTYFNNKQKQIKKTKLNRICIWNFLYSIARNYPTDNKLVTYTQKYYYNLFFKYLPKIYPNKQISILMEDYLIQFPIENYLYNSTTITKWLYGLEKSLTKCNLCYETRCNLVDNFRAGCNGLTDKKPTCRSK